jgi:hypothetical protein
MPRGDKSAYTGKQKRKAAHIETGYRERGVPRDEAERRAWATVNKDSGGGNLSGSGRGRPDTNASARKGGRRGGSAKLVAGPAARQSATTRKGTATGRTKRKRAARS